MAETAADVPLPVPAIRLSMLLLAFTLAEGWSAACDEPPVGLLAQSATAVPPGPWGGRGISLEVAADGARVEYDCAHGRITGRIATDREGRFDTRGTFVRERGGPQREGEEARAQPARYVGLVEGASMTLTVLLTSTNETVGPFSLTHGQAGVVRKCL